MSDIDSYFESDKSDSDEDGDESIVEDKKQIGIEAEDVEPLDDEEIDDDVEILDDDEEIADDDDDEDDKIIGGAKEYQSDNEDNNIMAKVTGLDDEDDDEGDGEDDDANYLQRFNNELTTNYINEYHPECNQHNYEEVKDMTKLIRNSDNIIIDPFHKTLPCLTKYEKARILGQRSKQIECGSLPFVKVPEGIIDSYVIAELELQQKKIPFIIKRPIPNGGFEYWNLTDLEIIAF
jgi:DNA-directed RNA polymerase I, II, and III subunit RPABC2